MKRFALSLGTLVHFDVGKVCAAFDVNLARVVKDMLDRPAEKEERRLTMQCYFEPITDSKGNHRWHFLDLAGQRGWKASYDDHIHFVHLHPAYKLG